MSKLPIFRYPVLTCYNMLHCKFSYRVLIQSLDSTSAPGLRILRFRLWGLIGLGHIPTPPGASDSKRHGRRRCLSRLLRLHDQWTTCFGGVGLQSMVSARQSVKCRIVADILALSFHFSLRFVVLSYPVQRKAESHQSVNSVEQTTAPNLKFFDHNLCCTFLLAVHVTEADMAYDHVRNLPKVAKTMVQHGKTSPRLQSHTSVVNHRSTWKWIETYWNSWIFDFGFYIFYGFPKSTVSCGWIPSRGLFCKNLLSSINLAMKAPIKHRFKTIAITSNRKWQEKIWNISIKYPFFIDVINELELDLTTGSTSTMPWQGRCWSSKTFSWTLVEDWVGWLP